MIRMLVAADRFATHRSTAPLLVAIGVCAVACRRDARPFDAQPLDASAAAAPAALPSHLAPYAGPEQLPAHDRVELGRLLFFDVRLSGDGTKSCATCHDPQKGFTDGLARAIGKDGKVLRRNTPSVVNPDARAPFFWDGRSPTLEEQALGPITNPDEMAKDVGALVTELGAIPEYVARFRRAFPDAPIGTETIGGALAAFERSLVSADAPFDRYQRGETGAMNPRAVRGLDLFVTKAACIKCHDGAHLTDASFHDIGVRGDDAGRFEIVPVEVLRGAFKTPGLRDVEKTAPYFHDGSAASLLDVVEHYDRGGDRSDAHLDPDIRPLGLSAEDKDALVEFMRALTGKDAPLPLPRVPRVVAKPRARSTRELMKSADGMLDSLDKLVTRLDCRDWEASRALVEQLIANAEELAALRLPATHGPDRPLLLELSGNIVVELRDLDGAIGGHRVPEVTASYERVRGACEHCHEQLRDRGKRR
jgi:cytochrome c peroxidase